MKITKMRSVLLAGAGMVALPFVANTNRTYIPSTHENDLIAPKYGTIVEYSHLKYIDSTKFNLKSTTYLKNKSAISLLSKVK